MFLFYSRPCEEEPTSRLWCPTAVPNLLPLALLLCIPAQVNHRHVIYPSSLTGLKATFIRRTRCCLSAHIVFWDLAIMAQHQNVQLLCPPSEFWAPSPPSSPIVANSLNLRDTFIRFHCPTGHTPGLYYHGANTQRSTLSVLSPYKGEKLWPLSFMGKDLELSWSWS